jgi:hypothetical protein
MNAVVYAPTPNNERGTSLSNKVMEAYGPFRTLLHEEPVTEQIEFISELSVEKSLS